MIISMTGYGQSTTNFNDKRIKVELKSLNGKTTDLRIRIPQNYKEKEVEVRKIVLNAARRGKLDISISIDSPHGEEGFGLNKPLFKKYYHELADLQKELGIEGADVVQAILRIPNIVAAQDEEVNEEEWTALRETILNACDNLRNHRKVEGDAMREDLNNGIVTIEDLLSQVDPFEAERIETIKLRMKTNLQAHLNNEKVDENRFEQEMIYYIEKLDINEEKIRLAQHCKYFKEIMDGDQEEIGKKLGFIAQEIGREINTLGAKSQHAQLQLIVVKMKDQLEKIKEQNANIV